MKYCRDLSMTLSFAVFLLTSIVFSTNVPAQDKPESDPRHPVVTPIKGGYHLEWPSLTDVGAVRIKGPWAGRYELMFDVRREDIDRKPEAPQDPVVLLPIADYWIVRGRADRAIPLYRRGLVLDPDNFTFQNNIAMLLSSAENKHDEAIDVIDKALETRLDNVTLLDTKGMILINARRADEAVPVLERAVILSCHGPIYMLHFAKALDMDGQEIRSREWFEKTRPFLDGPTNKLSKENQEIFDGLKMKYGQ